MAKPGPVVVNASARPRSGIVELVVAGDPLDGACEQILSTRASLPGTLTLDASSVASILGLLQGARIADDAWIHGVEVGEDDTGIDLTVSVGTEELPGIALDALKENLAARLAARPDAVVRVRLDQPPIRRIVARVTEVPGLGWASYSPAPLVHPVTARLVTATDDAAGPLGAAVLTNGLVEVVIDPAEGTFSIDGHGGPRTPGRRGRPRRLLQLLAAAPGLDRRQGRGGADRVGRGGAGAGRGRDQRRLSLARGGRGHFVDAPRRDDGHDHHQDRAARGRDHGQGDDLLRQPGARPPPPGPLPTARALHRPPPREARSLR